jgi:hypothetical protein
LGPAENVSISEVTFIQGVANISRKLFGTSKGVCISQDVLILQGNNAQVSL